MKKLVIAIATGTITVLLPPNVLVGQNIKTVVAVAPGGSDTNTGSTHPVEKYQVEGYALANVKAVRHFRQHYKVENEKWTTGVDCLVAQYDQNEIRHTIFYKKNGTWVATMSTYSEKNLPREIRAIVKSTFYDYSIGTVNEIQTEDSNEPPTYVMVVKNQEEIKKIKVREGNMEILESYARSGSDLSDVAGAKGK